MGIQEALEFFEIPKGRHQTLENVWGKTFGVDALYLIDENLSYGSLDSLRGCLLYQFVPYNTQHIANTLQICTFDYLYNKIWYLT